MYISIYYVCFINNVRVRSSLSVHQVVREKSNRPFTFIFAEFFVLDTVVDGRLVDVPVLTLQENPVGNFESRQDLMHA
jgi:hypothetical protein